MKDMKNLSIEERIEKSGLFDFCDGYLGSTEEGYYEGVDEVNDIKSENDLNYIILDDLSDDTFDKWFGDCDESEIIEDLINGGNGYGKIIVNKEEKFIKVMVVPCLYSEYSSDKESDIKIFGFDFNNGELVREIESDKLNEILKDKDYYIG
jgi:predicted nucleic-acid-binding Zn-ribbon protein